VRADDHEGHDVPPRRSGRDRRTRGGRPRGRRGERREAFLRRDDESENELAVAERDDDSGDSGGGDSGGFTSGVNSNDAMGSRFTPVTWDKDRSRGDLTRDRTDDGAGGPKRDWSRHQTNDWTRHDSR
jgi:hypothetical protein